jgi:ABC-type oligopeptide transport system ATPase subunit
VDLEIYKGETFGLVGESGCGKSTSGDVSAAFSDNLGKVFFEGRDISKLKGNS